MWTISGAKVVAGFWLIEDEDFNKLAEQKMSPERIAVS